MKQLLYLTVALISINFSQAQTYKFGKVSKNELAEKTNPLDSSANATILYSEQITEFDFNENEGFFIRSKYFVRIKIYNKDGADWASKKIHLHQQHNRKEKAIGIKAVTYNLENGKIVKTALSKKSIFREELNKYTLVKKFTLPNIKNGSIIEYRYTTESPFFSSFSDVVLQHTIPVKKFYAQIAIPEYFVYKTHTKGYFPIKIAEKTNPREIRVIYRTSGAPGQASSLNNGSLNFQEQIKTISKENIPALEREPYAGNLKNYFASVVFELNYIDLPRQIRKLYSTDWLTVSKKIYENDRFGAQLKKSNHFKGDLNNALAGSDSELNKISRVLAFVKSKIKWNNYNGYLCDKGTRKAYVNGEGNVADINLNLIAMLRKAGFEASPVLVSTVKHGVPLFPTREGFNYVIALVTTSKGAILLDATQTYTTLNVLPEKVYNYQGRIIENDGSSAWVNLFPQTHSSSKQSVRAQFTGTGFKGSARRIISNNFLYDYRNEMSNLTKEKQLEKLESHKHITIEKLELKNLSDLTKNAIESIQFSSSNFYENLGGNTYITPSLFLQQKENPFKSETRQYPVFYNKPILKSSTIYINIPNEYEIVQVPEPLVLNLPDSLGGFSYQVTQQGQVIVVKATFAINHAVIPTTAYKALQKLYTAMINKQEEKIVLKKK